MRNVEVGKDKEGTDLAVRRSNHSARHHPLARSNPLPLENRRRLGVRGRKGQRIDNLKIDGGGELGDGREGGQIT